MNTNQHRPSTTVILWIALSLCSSLGFAPTATATDYRNATANDWALATIAPSVDPTPEPAPAPGKCQRCGDTGWITHGDGHKTRCPECNQGELPTGPIDTLRNAKALVDKYNRLADQAKAILDAAQRAGKITVDIRMPGAMPTMEWPMVDVAEEQTVAAPVPDEIVKPVVTEPTPEPKPVAANPWAGKRLVLFWMEKCEPCKTAKQIAAKLTAGGMPVWYAEFAKRPDLTAKLPAEWNVRAMPCWVVFTDGKPTAYIVGASTISDVRAAMGVADAGPETQGPPAAQDAQQFIEPATPDGCAGGSCPLPIVMPQPLLRGGFRR
jgi:hypothetical protein